jgi:putative oxidoreductase
MNLLSKHSDTIYVLLRIVSGALFTFHGTQKIFGWLASHETVFASQMWFGGLIELICGLCLILGFQTRIAAFISSGTMAVAYIQFHWVFQLDANFFPGINHGDAAVLYCFLFLFIASKGAGKLCLDKTETVATND